MIHWFFRKTKKHKISLGTTCNGIIIRSLLYKGFKDQPLFVYFSDYYLTKI